MWGECFVEVGSDSIATIGCVPYLIVIILDAAVKLAGVVALGLIIWGGVKFLRSGGDPEMVKSARQTITYAIIGLILVFSSYYIVRIIGDLTGVDCIETFGFQQCGGGTSSSGKPYCDNNVPFTEQDFERDECDCRPGYGSDGTACVPIQQ